MRNSTNSKEVLLQCALELFSKKGYESTGISELVSTAGVTKPTLYYFFGSKEGIFKEILDKYYGELNKELADSAEYEPIPKPYEQDIYLTLIKTANTLFSFAERNKNFYIMALSFNFALPNSEVAKIVKPYVTKQDEILENSFKEMAKLHGNMRGKEERYAHQFLAMVNSAISRWISRNETLDDETVITIVRLFLHGAFN